MQVMGSEVGVVDIPNWDIASKGRLMPGNIFLVDFDAGRVIKDEEVGRFCPSHLPLTKHSLCPSFWLRQVLAAVYTAGAS